MSNNGTNLICDDFSSSAELVEVITREMRDPLILDVNDHHKQFAIPPGWNLVTVDETHLRSAPARKKGTVSLSEADSFIDYCKRQGSLTHSTIWCACDFMNGKVDFTGIFNDHSDNIETGWRDHLAKYRPAFSKEWRTWIEMDQKPFTQMEFSAFLERNLKDIASGESLPTGSQMLEMALSFEHKAELRFKSAIRLQSGAVNLAFVEDEDSGQVAQMQIFERFAIGIPVFWAGQAYQLSARLRYRVRDAKLTFFYELIGHEKVLEDATRGLVDHVKSAVGFPFFYGNPNIT